MKTLAEMINDDLMVWLSKWIESEIGIVFSEHNRYQLQSRVENLVSRGLISKPEDLRKDLYDPKKESLRSLITEMATNHETLFFRDQRFFEVLENFVIPQWVQRQKPIRVWSAAASTGQEIFSLVILSEKHGLRKRLPKIEFIATDVSEDVIAKAKKGEFNSFEISRGLNRELQSDFFNQDHQTQKYILKPDLRNQVKFETMNLLKPHLCLESFDLILLRNVLIYFSIPNRTKVLNFCREHMNPQGLLVLGAGETLLGVSQEWTSSLIGGLPFFSLLNS